MIRGFRAACRAGAAVVVSAGMVVAAASGASALGQTPELLDAVDVASVTETVHGATDMLGTDVLGTTTPVLTTGGYGDDWGHDDGHGDKDRHGHHGDDTDVDVDYDEDRIGDESINVLNDVEVEVLSDILSGILNDNCIVCN